MSDRDRQETGNPGAMPGLMRNLLRGAVLGGGIKVASVGLAFLFFMVLARGLDAEQYGVFAAAFSLATILGFGATIGQHTAILRFWPTFDERYGEGVAARAALRGLLVAAAGGSAVFAAFAVLAATPIEIGAFGGDRVIYLWTGAMALAFAVSEFAVAALRAQGSLGGALVPREIVWRLAVIGAVLALPLPRSGAGMLALAALALLAVTLPQLAVLLRMARRHGEARIPAAERPALRRATSGLWGLSIVNQTANHGATVAVGLALGPSAAGAFFAADRLAKLLSIALVGVNQVAGPMIARSYHGGRIEEVRLLSAASSAIALAAAALGYVVFALAGDRLLALFDPAYQEAYPVLLLLGLGNLVNAGTGLNGLLLTLTGQERALSRIVAAWGLGGVAAVYVAGQFFGLTGAAVCSAGLMIGWNLAAMLKCRQVLGVDPFSPRLLARLVWQRPGLDVAGGPR